MNGGLDDILVVTFEPAIQDVTLRGDYLPVENSENASQNMYATDQWEEQNEMHTEIPGT
jgi:hypothetical protein